MQPTVKKNPNRRSARNKNTRSLLRQSMTPIATQWLACRSRLSIGPAIKDRNGKRLKDLMPAPPAHEISQIISAHNPDELVARVLAPDPTNSIGGILAAIALLTIADTNRWMARFALGGSVSLFEWLHACQGFQRVLRRNNPPQFIQAKPIDSLPPDMEMAVMGGIERTTEQSDLAASRWFGRDRPNVEDVRRRAREGVQYFQGRT